MDEFEYADASRRLRQLDEFVEEMTTRIGVCEGWRTFWSNAGRAILSARTTKSTRPTVMPPRVRCDPSPNAKRRANRRLMDAGQSSACPGNCRLVPLLSGEPVRALDHLELVAQAFGERVIGYLRRLSSVEKMATIIVENHDPVFLEQPAGQNRAPITLPFFGGAVDEHDIERVER